MSQHENGRAECPFSGHGEELINIKFFRGTRDDVIGADEIEEQMRSARMQARLRTATRSRVAPVSAHGIVDVRELVSAI